MFYMFIVSFFLVEYQPHEIKNEPDSGPLRLLWNLSSQHVEKPQQASAESMKRIALALWSPPWQTFPV